MFGNTKFPVSKGDDFRYIKLGPKKSGFPPLVLLHGMFGGLSNFDPFLQQTDNITFFVPEIPIYDFSKSDLTIPGLAKWLREILEERELKKPVLLGNSMGGHIALEYALRYGDEITALILTGSSGLMENDLGSSRPKRYDRNYIKERAAMTFYEDLVNDTIIDEILDVLQSPEKLGRLLAIARSTHSYNMENRLEEIHHPTMLIWGKNDEITPPKVAEMFLEKMPNAELKWIDRCGHAPMMERPVQFAEIVKGFLKKLLNKSSTKNSKSHEKDYSHS